MADRPADRPGSPLSLLERDPLFGGASRAALSSLLGAAEPVGWEDGEAIYRRGEPAESLVLVARGRIRLGAGAAATLVEGPGRCGEEAAGLGVRACDAVAEGPVEGFLLPRPALAAFARARPSFAVDATAALAEHLGGAAIPHVRRPEPQAEPPLSAGEIAGWATVLVGPLLVRVLAGWAGATEEAGLFAAILAAVVLLWSLGLVDEFVPPLVGTVAILVLGLAPPQVALAGFSSPSLLTLLGVFALSATIGASGLSRRLMLRLLASLPDGAAWQQAVLLGCGAVLSPVTPSANARFSLLFPLQREIADGLRLAGGGIARTAMLAAAFDGALLFSPLLATSKSSNLAAIELLPSQVRDEFRGAWWLVGAAVAAIGLVACQVLSMRRFFPSEDGSPLPRARIEEQLRLLGPPTTTERHAAGGFLFFLAGTLTQSWHHVPSPWLAGILLVALLLTGIFGRAEFRAGIDWPMVFFLLGMDGLTRTMTHVGVDAAFARAAAGLFGFVGDRIVVFVLVALATTLLVRLVLPTTAGMLVSAIVLLPVAAAGGIHPWICIFLAALFSDVWFFRHQSTVWTQVVSGGLAQAVDERRFLAHERLLNLARVAVAFLSIPWWRWLGLL